MYAVNKHNYWEVLAALTIIVQYRWSDNESKMSVNYHHPSFSSRQCHIIRSSLICFIKQSPTSFYTIIENYGNNLKQVRSWLCLPTRNKSLDASLLPLHLIYYATKSSCTFIATFLAVSTVHIKQKHKKQTQTIFHWGKHLTII